MVADRFHLHDSLSFFPCISISLPRSYVSVHPSTLFETGHIAFRLTVNLIPAFGLSSTLSTLNVGIIMKLMHSHSRIFMPD